ncbi:MAG: hypothetical protein ACLFP2_00810 [Candidatus Woesearchaeota archaeon]
MTNRLTFNSSAKKDILGFFGKEINEESFIIEKDTQEPVIGLDGTEVHEDEFAGLRKGSEIFLKNDLISIMRLADETR